MQNRLRLIINFKNTEEDYDLYKEITSHSSISGYVKDSLRELKKLKEKENEKCQKEKEN